MIPALSILMKPASGLCNMRCRYCFYADEMRRRSTPVFRAMDGATAEAIVRRGILAVDQSVTFGFQGGEPTLAGAAFFRRFLELERQYNAGRGVRITNTLQTNGLELDGEMIEVLREGDFLVGVSVDGTREIHDSRRIDAAGRGTFDRVMANLERLEAAGIACNILCVVDDEIARRPGEVFEALAPHRFIQFIACLDPLEDGAGGGWLSPEVYGSFLIETYRLYARSARRGRFVSVRLFDNWLAMLSGRPPESCGMLGHCAPYLLVEGDGSAYPCDFYALDRWYLGNVRDTPFPRMLHSDAMRRFLEPSFALPERCKACEYLPICRGGCRRDRDRGGALGDNRLCAAFRMFFDACLDDMRGLCRELAGRG